MKLLTAISIGVLLFFCSLNSYTQYYFNKRYDYYDRPDWGGSIINLDSGYVMQFSSTDSSGYYDIILLFLNNKGDTLYAKSHGKDGCWYYPGVNAMTKTSDDGFAIGTSMVDTFGYYTLLMKLNPKGDTMWIRKYGGGNKFYNGAQCKQTEDKGFVIIGAWAINDQSNTDILLIKTDSMGNLEWEKTYGGGGIESGFTVELTNDGGYILGGYTTSYGAGDADSYIIKVDSLGNEQWSETYGGIYRDNVAAIIKTLDGGFIFAGAKGVYKQNNNIVHKKISIIKIDSAGTILWDKVYGPMWYGNGSVGIIELEDGSYIIAAQADTMDGSARGALLKVSDQGDSIWWRWHTLLTGESSVHYFRDFKQTEDRGFIVTGFITPVFPDTGTQDMWVIKLDSMGCPFPGCDTVQGVIYLKPQANKISVHPNPASHILTVTSSTGEKIIITDMMGRKIREYKSFNNQLIINVTEYDNGIYFLAVYDKLQFVTIEKIIIVK